MAEGKGGQLLAWQGEPGLIMRGAGMFFSLPSLMFTHKKGKLEMYALKRLCLQLCGICVYLSERFTKVGWNKHVA